MVLTWKQPPMGIVTCQVDQEERVHSNENNKASKKREREGKRELAEHGV